MTAEAGRTVCDRKSKQTVFSTPWFRQPHRELSRGAHHPTSFRQYWLKTMAHRNSKVFVPDDLKRRAAPFIRSCGSAPPVQKCGTNRTCLFSGGRPSGVLLQRRKFPYGAVLPNNICGTARPTPRCPQGFPSSAK